MSIRAALSALLGVFLSASPVLAIDVVNGLNAEFFADTTFKKSVAKRIDPNIDWQWVNGSPMDSVPIDHFSVRWTGWIKAVQPGRYNLILQGDDICKFSLDGRPVIDDWKPGDRYKSMAVDLTGKPQKIQIDFIEHDYGAWVSFWWMQFGSTQPTLVPTEVLFPTEAMANFKGKSKHISPYGLTADYFDVEFKRHLGRTRVHRAEALWGESHPVQGAPLDGAVRVTGYLVPPISGEYKLMAYADDLVRVSIDGAPVVEGGGTAKRYLQAGMAYALTIEFVDTFRWGYYILHWVPPNSTTEVSIPCETLYPVREALPKRIRLSVK